MWSDYQTNYRSDPLSDKNPSYNFRAESLFWFDFCDLDCGGSLMTLIKPVAHQQGNIKLPKLSCDNRYVVYGICIPLSWFSKSAPNAYKMLIPGFFFHKKSITKNGFIYIFSLNEKNIFFSSTKFSFEGKNFSSLKVFRKQICLIRNTINRWRKS